MITKFKIYNESISSLLVGPTKEEVWINLMDGKLKGLIKSVPKSPEDFFFQMKEDCTILQKGTKNIYWGKNNIILFYQDTINKELYISFKDIWSVFQSVYTLDYDETQSLIKNIISNDTEWKGYYPMSVTEQNY